METSRMTFFIIKNIIFFTFLISLCFSSFFVFNFHNNNNNDSVLLKCKLLTWMRCSSRTLYVSCISFIFNSTLNVVDWILFIVPITILKSDNCFMFRSRLSRSSYHVHKECFRVNMDTIQKGKDKHKWFALKWFDHFKHLQAFWEKHFLSTYFGKCGKI